MNELKPEMLTLTESQKNDNCWRIKYDGAVEVEARVKAAKNYSENSCSYMLEHLRGNILKTHTKIAKISDSSENKVVAVKEIPAGTLLGAYFGEAITLNHTPHDHNISKQIAVRDESGKFISAFHVIGKINGKQTMAATMNHALTQGEIHKNYVFRDEFAKQKAAFANVIVTQMKVNINGIPRDLEIFIAANTIKPHEALHWPYYHNESSLLSQIGGSFYGDRPTQGLNYFESRNMKPLLFNKNGDFLDQMLYRERSKEEKAFSNNKKVVLFALGIMGTLATQLLREDSNKSFSFFTQKKLISYSVMLLLLFTLNKMLDRFASPESSVTPQQRMRH